MAEKRMTDGSMALQEKQYRVITIEATEKPQKAELRVAAYARVSSASDDQLNSFAAQNRHYSDLISSRDNWRMVDIYADEGITGTSAEKRQDFQRLLADCRRGLIDKVLVKSISRFARNTKECLEAIRELKSLGIGVYFEKEAIDTGTMSGEMMTTLFASFAQAESESISGNMRWSYQRRMQSGTYLPSSVPYGYRICNRQIAIDEEEAKVVRRIFRDYLAGINMAEIAASLNRKGIPKRKNNAEIIWHKASIRYILSNERYVGDSLWQKTYMTDAFPPVMVRNRGEKEMYYTPEQALQRELDSVMEQQPIDEGAAQKLILAIAAAQYSAINPNQYETIRLRRLFSKHEPMTELDAKLLQSSVSAILCYSNGTLDIQLKNHQMIGRSETV